MIFNQTKCEFLQLTKNSPYKVAYHMHIDNKPIKQVTTTKYTVLGGHHRQESQLK